MILSVSGLREAERFNQTRQFPNSSFPASRHCQAGKPGCLTMLNFKLKEAWHQSILQSKKIPPSLLV